MGQTEGKQAREIQYYSSEATNTTPAPQQQAAQDAPTTTTTTTSAADDEPIAENQQELSPDESSSSSTTTTTSTTSSLSNSTEALTPRDEPSSKLGMDTLKRGTGELVGGITKIGSNIITTAKKVPYTSVSVAAATMPAFRKAATAVEDAIVTVKAGIVKSDEEPELTALSKMPLFFPIIRTSVPITDIAKTIPAKKTTIEYIDPKFVQNVLLEYQRYMIVTAKMLGARQAEVVNKIRDTEMSSARKAVFTLAMGVTDMRHFNTQFSEVARFHSNLERTKQSIKDILGMFEKLNAILPPEEQLEKIQIPATSLPSDPASTTHSSLRSFAAFKNPPVL